MGGPLARSLEPPGSSVHAVICAREGRGRQEEHRAPGPSCRAWGHDWPEVAAVGSEHMLFHLEVRGFFVKLFSLPVCVLIDSWEAR